MEKYINLTYLNKIEFGNKLKIEFSMLIANSRDSCDKDSISKENTGY